MAFGNFLPAAKYCLCLNANIIFNAYHQNGKNRRIFLKELGMLLMKPHLVMRASIRNLPIEMKQFLHRYKSEENIPKVSSEETRGRCVQCGRKKNRTTTITCQNCSQPACKEQVVTTHICLECNRSDTDDE